MNCHNCGELGHMAKDCPKGKLCHKCKKPGHMSIDCPSSNNNSNQGDNNFKNIICHICKQKGHMSRDCPSKKDYNNTGELKCYNCGKSGHKINECPDKKENGELKCYNCGKPGHKVEECPNKRGMYCYNCGKAGHRKAECPEKNKNNKNEDKKEQEDDKINLDENNVINCPICFGNSTSGKKFKVTNCGHIICKDCCEAIFKSNNKCPICKKEINKNNLVDIFV